MFVYFRKLYGLIKYIFKIKIDYLKLLDFYYIKLFFILWVDIDFNCYGLIVDLIKFYEIVYRVCEEQKIEYVFIKGCNIFLYYYIDRVMDNDKGIFFVFKNIMIFNIVLELCIFFR